MKKPEKFDWDEVQSRLRSIQRDAGLRETRVARHEILERRAAQLALPQATADPSSRQEMVMIIRIDEDRFALPLSGIVQVLRQARLTIVPGSPQKVKGLIQVRGEVRPVYDLRRILGLTGEAAQQGQVVVLLRHGAREFGVEVDEVEDIRPVSRQVQTQGGWMTEDLIPALTIDSLLKRGK